MIALSKKLISIFLVCFAIVGCSYEDTNKIRELQNQLAECRTIGQTDRETYYNSWASQKQNLNACVTANNNLYNFVDAKGNFLDRTAKLFTIHPWLTLGIDLVLILISMFFSFVGLRFLLKWKHNVKYKEAKATIENAKDAHDAILEVQSKLTYARGELNALEAQKITILNELERLKQYQNLDEIKEKAKIINEAHKEAEQVSNEYMNKINSQIATTKAKLNQERNQIAAQWNKLNQKELELEQKDKELEEFRKSIMGID